MIIKLLLASLLTVGFYWPSFAQIEFRNPPWETGCDSLTTQVEMNFCSYEKSQIAHKILTSYYEKIIAGIDSRYTIELEKFKAKKDKAQKEYVKELKKQKEATLKSQNEFEQLLTSTTDILYYQYEGGTMRPMVVNTYALELTVHQIKVLIKIMRDTNINLETAEEFWIFLEE